MAFSRGAVLFFKLLACLLWLFELSHGERLFHILILQC
jgi:fatty acid omega-hydroxy dehydrogenase